MGTAYYPRVRSTGHYLRQSGNLILRKLEHPSIYTLERERAKLGERLYRKLVAILIEQKMPFRVEDMNSQLTEQQRGALFSFIREDIPRFSQRTEILRKPHIYQLKNLTFSGYENDQKAQEICFMYTADSPLIDNSEISKNERKELLMQILQQELHIDLGSVSNLRGTAPQKGTRGWEFIGIYEIPKFKVSLSARITYKLKTEYERDLEKEQ